MRVLWKFCLEPTCSISSLTLCAFQNAFSRLYAPDPGSGPSQHRGLYEGGSFRKRCNSATREAGSSVKIWAGGKLMQILHSKPSSGSGIAPRHSPRMHGSHRSCSRTPHREFSDRAGWRMHHAYPHNCRGMPCRCALSDCAGIRARGMNRTGPGHA